MAEGSPPHTRDKFEDMDLKEVSIRITPAYAGQIFCCLFIFWLCEDHPRIRGTNLTLGSVRAVSWGSPPHTRDKFSPPFDLTHILGITPAYAGQIKNLVCLDEIHKDHPRIRGTNLFLIPPVGIILGSPPHTRDKSL